MIFVLLFSARQPLTTLARASKILQGKINLVPAILNYALNFSRTDTEVDFEEFQIIYEYLLHNNHEEKIEPFVFKNTLTHRSDISKLADALHKQLAENFEIRCGLNDADQPTIEISVSKRITLVEGLKNALSNYTSSSLETNNVAGLLDLIKNL